jgi:adenosylcobinamide-phosphate synthase
MTLTLTLISAVALDYCLGEPPNTFHPLAAFGRWANWLEIRFSKPSHFTERQKIYGILAWLCALIPILLLTELSLCFAPNPFIHDLLSIFILYTCIGSRSLQQHANAVYLALRQGDLPLAQQQVGKIVSRQTDTMQADDARRATIESVLENGADAVFAPLLWFVLLGPIGAVFYRLSNTLDAMWGYKNERFLAFGWAAARIDDVLNWLPARLTALSYLLLGNWRQAWHAWQEQAILLDSPNAGPVMTSGAGSLDLLLGGPAWYHGQLKQKIWFGGKQTPKDSDILRAISLIYRVSALWLLLIALGEYFA